MDIFLDTNIWIYLAKGCKDSLWEKLVLNKESLLTNEIIIAEWQRNKEHTIHTLSETIKNEYSCAKKLAKYLPEDEVKSFNTILSNYNKEECRINAARNHVNNVESLLFSTKKVEVTNDQINKIAQMAIQKKPPLNTSKNNFNDALILRSVIEYAHKKRRDEWSEYDVIFVSNNPTDFLDKSDNIHQALLDGCNGVSIKSVTELYLALKIFDEDDDRFNEWVDYMLDMEAQKQLDLIRGK